MNNLIVQDIILKDVILEDVKTDKPKRQYYKREYHQKYYAEKKEQFKVNYTNRKEHIKEALKLLKEQKMTI